MYSSEMMHGSSKINCDDPLLAILWLIRNITFMYYIWKKKFKYIHHYLRNNMLQLEGYHVY